MDEIVLQFYEVSLAVARSGAFALLLGMGTGRKNMLKG
jgi:hypothetical protein